MKTLGSMAVLLLISSGCSTWPATLSDTLGLLQTGRDAEVVAASEQELARWAAVDREVTAQLPEAMKHLDRVRVAEPLLLAEGEELKPPAQRGGGDVLLQPGAALRRLVDDLRSDAPLRILRATWQVAELRSRRLLPHVLANVFSHRPLHGEPGPVADYDHALRILIVKTQSARAVRAVLKAGPSPGVQPVRRGRERSEATPWGDGRGD